MTQNEKKVDLLVEQWEDVINGKSYEPITDDKTARLTAVMLENTLRADGRNRNVKTKDAIRTLAVARGAKLNEATNTANMAGFDLPIAEIIRAATPKILTGVTGVQPLDRPEGGVFYMQPVYGSGNPIDYSQPLFDGEADTAYTGTGTHEGDNPFDPAGTYTTGTGMATNVGELSSNWKPVSFGIKKIAVIAKTRNIRSNITAEMEQDLMNVHGLDARQELIQLMTDEAIAEINREIVRTIYTQAKFGAQDATTAGVFDCDVDSNGRWGAEKGKGILMQIEKEANAIAHETRRGRGNFIITSPNVASALAMTEALDYASNINRNIAIQSNLVGTGVTEIGMVNGMRLFVDPYLEYDGVVVGYRGESEFDNGVVYSPYTMLEYFSAQNFDNLSLFGQGLKSRYAISNSPVVSGNAGENSYYRKFAVKNISF